MTEGERHAAIVACQQLSVAFGNYVDQRRYAELGALFAPDGVFERAGVGVVGPAAIEAELAKRPAHWATLHFCTNVQIEPVDADHAVGRAYQFVLMQKDVTGDPPYPMPGSIEAAGIFEDAFVRTAAGWRFASRRTLSVFRR